MLASVDLRGLRHNSARYIHVVAEALKLAFADRERHYGDREDALASVGALLAPEYLRARAALIRMDRATAVAPSPGDPRSHDGASRGVAAGLRASGAAAPEAAADGTTHIAAIDRDGNMICLTPSGGVFRKSAFMPELGCTLSTRSEMFVLEEGHPNALAPGKRPRTTLVSYVICEGGEPTMTIGCPGGARPGLIRAVRPTPSPAKEKLHDGQSERQGRPLPSAAPGAGGLRDSKPVGRRLGAHPRRPRLSGTGDVERRLRRDSGPARR